mmetsp:Transcript_23408/g.88899  ORF Transcript_23408/g.88899 Transcript_23408/m.88899 type:complete len:215 (-) Transcript_23408:34-678(-)
MASPTRPLRLAALPATSLTCLACRSSAERSRSSMALLRCSAASFRRAAASACLRCCRRNRASSDLRAAALRASASAMRRQLCSHVCSAEGRFRDRPSSFACRAALDSGPSEAAEAAAEAVAGAAAFAALPFRDCRHPSSIRPASDEEALLCGRALPAGGRRCSGETGGRAIPERLTSDWCCETALDPTLAGRGSAAEVSGRAGLRRGGDGVSGW